MCNLSQMVEDRGIMKGIAKGRTEEKICTTLRHIKKLMSVYHQSAEETMDLLEVDQDIRTTILEKLKQEQNQ